MKSNYMGLWAGRTGWYCSKAMTQKQIRELPEKCRIILRENKYHKNNKEHRDLYSRLPMLEQAAQRWRTSRDK